MTLKRLIKPLLVSCVVPLAFSANAEMSFMDKNNFVLLSAGMNQPSIGNNNGDLNSAKTNFIAAVEVGRKFYDRVSLSLEYKYFSKTKFNISDYTSSGSTTNSIYSHSWSVRSDVFMANIAFDLIEADKITPYVKVGAGFSRNKANDYEVNEKSSGAGSLKENWSGKTSNRFAWQVGAGIDLKTSDMITTNISYNFVNRGKFETKEAKDYSTGSNEKIYTNLQDHVFTIGVKFKF